MTPRERVSLLLNGTLPDRPPHFDLIRNDAVLSHFAGEELTVENAERLVYRAVNRAVDATRPMVRCPQRERVETLSDGRKVHFFRWTTWTEHPRVTTDEFAQQVKESIEQMRQWTEREQASAQKHVDAHRTLELQMPDVYLFWSAPGGVGLSNLCHGVGLEQFCYFLADYPDLVSDYLECHTTRTVKMVREVAKRARVGVYMLGEDIAFKGTTMFRPEFLRREFMGRLRRIVDTMHETDTRVMFHSDGNLMEILDDLVATGIDLLNPIEVMAGMDIAEIHRRAPHLIMVGGIDVSHLLPFGTPEAIQEAVRKAVHDAEGCIMVGSSTELQYVVPLHNYLAMRETIHSIRY